MNRLQKIRKETIAAIKAIFDKYTVDTIEATDLDMGSSPILESDAFDGNNNLTLDRVILEKGELYFVGSSCFGNVTFNEETISTDALCNVADFLEENEEDIAELNEKEI